MPTSGSATTGATGSLSGRTASKLLTQRGRRWTWTFRRWPAGSPPCTCAGPWAPPTALGVTAQPGSIVGARSCLTHGEAGEICLELDPAGIEPRSDGLQLIEFDVSQPAASVNAAVDCVNTLYTGTVTATGYGGTVEVEFDESRTDRDAIARAIESQGFEVPAP